MDKRDESKILTLYQIFGRITDDWFLDAARLKQAANVILDAIAASENHPYIANLLRGQDEPLKGKNDWLMPVYMFLAGASIENLVKAILIGRDMQYVERTRIAATLGIHDLGRLMKLASFALTRDQGDLVGRLTRWIYWAGRYPVPKNSKDSADDFSQKLNLHNASDPAAIDLLFASLQAIYVAEQTAREEKWTALSESRPKAGPQELLRLDAAIKRVAEDAAATQRVLANWARLTETGPSLAERLLGPQQQITDLLFSPSIRASAPGRLPQGLSDWTGFERPVRKGSRRKRRPKDVDDSGPGEA